MSGKIRKHDNTVILCVIQLLNGIINPYPEELNYTQFIHATHGKFALMDVSVKHVEEMKRAS